MHRNAYLLEVVEALAASSAFPRSLHGGQQDGYQDPDDRDHDKQFDERKTV